MDEKNNKNKGVHNSNINCMSCIYDDHHLNLYKMGVFKN